MTSRAKGQGQVKARQEAAARLRARREREDELVGAAIVAVEERATAREALEDSEVALAEALGELGELGLSAADVAGLIDVTETEAKATLRSKRSRSRDAKVVEGTDTASN